MPPRPPLTSPGSSASRDALEEALDEGRIRPWFQPIVHLRSGTVVGLEALARWEHADGRVEPADVFVPLAEESGLAVRLDLAVLDAALQDLASWQRLRPDLSVNVNFSGRDLDDPAWADSVVRAGRRHAVSPSTVHLELTEVSRPGDAAQADHDLALLREEGFELWLDDFGTGWSQVQHLVELPVDGLKLDRFLAGGGNARADVLLQALTGAARALGIRTTLEGIQDRAQAQRAADLGCDLGQGFWWSPAVPAARVLALLDSGGEGVGR